MKKPDLKPCPFCGKEAIVQKKSSGHNKVNGEYTASFFIGCKSCKIGFSCDSTFVLNCGEVMFIHNGYEEAKTLWNTRVSKEVADNVEAR